MKNYLNLLLLVSLLFAACKKDQINIEPLASLNVANAVIGGKVARLNSNLRDSCTAMGFKLFTLKAGVITPIKLFASSKPSSPYYNQSQTLENGGLYSLFLTGTETAPEAVLIKDVIPEYPTSQVINVRLVNLAPGSPALSLTMGNAPASSVFVGVAYKQVSEFKTLDFPLTLPVNGNQFQIRDGMGNLLTTYVLPTSGAISQNASRKRNLTLIVKGIQGMAGSDAFGAFMMPSYNVL